MKSRANTGPVVLSGGLYHHPEERTLKKVPTTEFDREQSAASRASIEAFLRRLTLSYGSSTTSMEIRS